MGQLRRGLRLVDDLDAGSSPEGQPMTPDDVRKLGMLLLGATQGPWEWDPSDRVVRAPNRAILYDDSCQELENADYDGPFIALMRNLIGDLLGHTGIELWTCDSCMYQVTRDQIVDFADGEHVLCVWCMRDEKRWYTFHETVVGKVREIARRYDIELAHGMYAEDAVSALAGMLDERVSVEDEDLRERLERAVKRLEENLEANRHRMFERSRLEGKIDGVKLALSYIREKP